MQTEVIHGQCQCFSHFLKPALHVLRHDVNLHNLFVVMQFERCEIGLRELLLPVRLQTYGHGRPEDGEPLVEPDDFLLVQPQQGAIKQLWRYRLFGLENQVGLQRRQQFAQGRFRQLIDATCAGWQASEQMFEQASGRCATTFSCCVQGRPLALQFNRNGLGVDSAQLETPAPLLFVSPVCSKAAQQLA